MKNKPLSAIISDAPESNAGDDFHIKWGVHKSLELLNFEVEGLKALTVEGVYYGESSRLDSRGQKLLGVDLGEYYGGNNFNDAKIVIFSQMKYSTRNASDAYTAAKLCENKGKGKVNSIISRLASVFQTYYDDFGSRQVTNKLKIKLVTNRHINLEFLNRLNEIQFFLSKKQRIGLSRLKQTFPKALKELDRLFAASGLSAPAFVDFLRVLDFSDCGTGSRFTQKIHALKLLSGFGDFNIDGHYKDLYHLVLDKAMPESRATNKIELADVLLSLRVGNIDSLFPVSSKIERPEYEITREQATDIVTKIKEAQHQIICLHGGAGMGKSTLVSSLTGLWPENSISVLYDCYGQGAYLDYSEARHVHSNACLQIINELALKVGTPVLLPYQLSNGQYMTELRRRVQAASQQFKNIFPQAFLVIIVDAADNSVVAAQERNEDCFIHDLVTMELPENCRLLVTTRTNRVDGLRLVGVEHVSIEILPFTRTETELFLRKHFNNASEGEIDEFHDLTHMTPRVQAYSLQGKSDINAVFKFLKPYGKTVENLIDGHIQSAKKRLGTKTKVDKILKAMVALPRPIPVKYIAELSGVKEAEVKDFCVDLWSGLIFFENFVAFRDEDFENHLRAQYSFSEEDYEDMAKVFLQHSDNEMYAAVNLGDALFNSGMISDLHDIVLGDTKIHGIKDPLKKRRTQLKRAQLAFKGANDLNDNLTFFKLLFLAAEAQKSNQAQMTILKDNIDLVMSYSDLKTIQELYFGLTSSVNYGAANFECAAYFSRSEKTKQYAIEHLRQGEHWLELLARTKKRNRLRHDSPEITEKQIAKGAEAILFLYGPLEVKRWLMRLRSKQTALTVLRKLVGQIVKTVEINQIYAWLKYVRRLDVEIIVSVVLLKSGKVPENNLVDLAKRLVAYMYKSPNREFLILAPYVVSLCEHLAQKKESVQLVQELALYFTPSPPEYSPSYHAFNDENIQNDTFFKFKTLIYCLGDDKEIDVESFYHEKFKKSNNKKTRHSDREQFDALYKHLIPIYVYRAKVITGSFDGDLIQEASRLLTEVSRDYRFSLTLPSNQMAFNHFILVLSELLVYTAQKKQLILTLYNFIKEDFINIRLIFLNRMIPYSSVSDVLFLLLSQISSFIEGSKLHATDIISNYISCSRIAYDAGDYMESKLYFDKAVAAGSQVDYDTYDQIRAIALLTYSFDNHQSQPILAHKFRCFIEYCKEILSGFDHFPAEDSLMSLEMLDFSSAISTYCRWHHADIVLDGGTEHSYWFRWLKISLDKKELSLHQVFALSGFSPINTGKLELGDALIEQFENMGSKSDKMVFLEEIVLEVATYGNIESRKNWVEELLLYFKKHNVSQGSVYDILLQMKLLYNLKDEARERYPRDKTSDSLDVIVEGVDPTNSISIEAALNKIAKNAAYGVHDILLGKIRDKCSTQNSLQHLNALIELSHKSVSYSAFFEGLKGSLEKWSHKQTTKQWKSDNYQRTLERYFFDFKHDSYYDYDHLSVSSLIEISEVFGKNNIDLALALKTIFPKLIDQFPSGVLYQATKVFRVLLNDTEKLSLIDWSLDRWGTSDVLRSEYEKPFEIPCRTISESYAFFLRYKLGNPSKNLRWSAVHAIRRLVIMGDTEILDYLIREMDSRDCGTHQYKPYTYFWLSSKLWLFILLDRLAKESPAQISKYSKIILGEALRKENGHALIRFFAKEACLKLIQFEEGIFTKEETDKLKLVLVGQYEMDCSPSQKGEIGKTTKTKFDFNRLDTLPYWYQPLGSVFGKNAYYVANLADDYIYNYLGFDGNINDEEFVYSKESLNGHGISPKVESLQIYYEYHGMFLAANELIEKYPIADYEDIKDEDWVEWISSEALSYPPFWLSDIRGNIPLESKFYNIAFDNRSGEWVWNVQSNDFAEFVGVDSDESTKKMTVCGNLTRKHDNMSESVDIDSALVKKDKAFFLLKALQTSDKVSYALPREGSENEIDNYGYCLKGWIQEDTNFNTDGLDQTDSLGNAITNTFITPGKILVENLGLKLSLDKRRSFECNNNETVTEFDNWYDLPSMGSEAGSQGNRLTISKDNLIKFLQSVDMALIVQCVINRYVSRRYYDDNSKSEQTSYYKLFLIYPDGKVRTLNQFY